MCAQVNLFWTAVLMLGIAGAAYAAVITPTGVNATTLAAGYEPINTINGSGLTGTGASATHVDGTGSGTMWLSDQSLGAGVGQTITFDLGGPTKLSAAYIWQYNQGPGQDSLGRGFKQYDVFVAGTNGVFPGSPLISAATLNQGGGTNAEPSQTLALSANARYVRFRVGATFPGATGNVAGLSEVRFEGHALPVRHYAMDDNAPSTTVVDAAATANAAYVSANTNTRHAAGLIGTGSLSLTTAPEYILLDNATDLNFPGAFTISGWIKTTDTEGMLVSLRNSGNGNPLIELGLKGSGGAFGQIRNDAGGNLDTLTSAAALNDGAWHQLTLRRRSDGFVDLFTDGIRVAGSTVARTGSISTSGQRAIGAELAWLQVNAEPNARQLLGDVDDVGAWSAALSDQEIALMAGLGRLGGVNLEDSSIYNVLDVYNVRIGTAAAGGLDWGFAQNLTGSVGTIGGSVAGHNAYIVLDAGGNGVAMADIPEPATMALLGLAVTGLGGYLRWRRTA